MCSLGRPYKQLVLVAFYLKCSPVSIQPDLSSGGCSAGFANCNTRFALPHLIHGPLLITAGVDAWNP